MVTSGFSQKKSLTTTVHMEVMGRASNFAPLANSGWSFKIFFFYFEGIAGAWHLLAPSPSLSIYDFGIVKRLLFDTSNIS